MKALVRGAAAGAVLMLASLAYAGLKNSAGTDPVYINNTYRYATGALGGVRTSADSTQYMGCSIDATGYGQCYATNSAGASAWCYTTDAAIVGGIAALSSNSYLEFDWNTSGQCTYINVDNGSFYTTKVH